MAAPPYGALQIGEDYVTVSCPSCGAVVPTAPAEGIVYRRPGLKTRLGCPFCGSTHVYDGSDFKVRELSVLPPTAH
jgi:predicted RNA-binding Zn-ribbon protein involved in translation (DUF1610 family)